MPIYNDADEPIQISHEDRLKVLTAFTTAEARLGLDKDTVEHMVVIGPRRFISGSPPWLAITLLELSGELLERCESVNADDLTRRAKAIEKAIKKFLDAPVIKNAAIRALHYYKPLETEGE